MSSLDIEREDTEERASNGLPGREYETMRTGKRMNKGEGLPIEGMR